jgi:hypothetical protein
VETGGNCSLLGWRASAGGLRAESIPEVVIVSVTMLTEFAATRVVSA